MEFPKKLTDFIALILAIILPANCLACGKFGESICDNCIELLPKEQSPYGVMTFFAYSDPIVQKAIWLIKYKSASSVIKPFARIIRERIIEELSETNELMLNRGEKIVIVPVPLSKERLKGRGFNQAEVLAREIIKIDSDQSFILGNNVIEKIKNTPTQVSIKNRSERLKNLKGAFALINTNAIKDRIVILLDDVSTTGTTLDECTKVLKHAKPRKIIRMALAH